MGARRYKAGDWATLGHMGYTGVEDEGVWAAMVWSDWEGKEGWGSGGRGNPPQGQTTSPQTPSHPNW